MSSRVVTAVVGAIVLIVSLVGVLVGKPIVDEQICTATGGTFENGICFPTEEPVDTE